MSKHNGPSVCDQNGGRCIDVHRVCDPRISIKRFFFIFIELPMNPLTLNALTRSRTWRARHDHAPNTGSQPRGPTIAPTAFSATPDRQALRVLDRQKVDLCLQNSRPFGPELMVPELHPLKKVLARANALGWVVRTTPPNWFAQTGDVAMTYHIGDEVYIFIERRPMDAYELLNTVLHEMVHGTGAILGRRDMANPPRKTDKAYWLEEAVAEVGAIEACKRFGVEQPELNRDLGCSLEEYSIRAVEKVSGHAIERSEVAARVRRAVGFIVDGERA